MKFLKNIPQEYSGKFLGAQKDYYICKTVLMGIPLDQTSTYRSGSRQSPQQIRLVSDALEEYSLLLKKDLQKTLFFDAGDLKLPFGNVTRCLDITRKAVQELLKDNKIPILMGGEHLITVPAVQALLEHYPDMLVLHFDAHADLRDCYLGESYSHASVIHLLLELGVKDIYQFGIRSATAEEEMLARKQTHFYPFEVVQSFQKCRRQLQDRPIYITIDIDVIDPAYAPGTGTPEPGGCTSSELLSLFKMFDGLNVVGFDLVEICPPFDPANVTVLLGAKIIREAILTFT